MFVKEFSFQGSTLYRRLFSLAFPSVYSSMQMLKFLRGLSDLLFVV